MARHVFDVSGVNSPAETITHTPAGGEAASVVAVVGEITDRMIDSEDGTMEILRRSVFVQSDEVDANIKDTFTIGGKVWSVEGIVEDDDVTTECACSRRQRIRTGQAKKGGGQ